LNSQQPGRSLASVLQGLDHPIILKSELRDPKLALVEQVSLSAQISTTSLSWLF